MGITLELAAHDEDTLDNLDDDSTDDQIASALFSESEHKCTLGRIWHVIHYILDGDVKGTERPEAFLLVGGRTAGPDGRYGAARVFSPDECKEIAAVLVDEQTFAERLAKVELPDRIVGADRIKPGTADPDYVEIYGELRALVTGAAERGDGLLLSIVG